MVNPKPLNVSGCGVVLLETFFSCDLMVLNIVTPKTKPHALSPLLGYLLQHRMLQDPFHVSSCIPYSSLQWLPALLLDIFPKLLWCLLDLLEVAKIRILTS